MGALVFKTSGRRRKAGCGGFDSHAFPQNIPAPPHGFPAHPQQRIRQCKVTHRVWTFHSLKKGRPLRFERIVLYPYPDLKRVWSRVWLTAVLRTRSPISN